MRLRIINFLTDLRRICLRSLFVMVCLLAILSNRIQAYADILSPAARIQRSGLDEIEHITNSALEKELLLLDLDTRFRIENTRQSKWKPWRIFTYKLAASGVTEAGITTVAISRWRYYTDPKQAPRNLLKAGPIMNLTGASIVIGGTLIESILSRLRDHQLALEGLDAKATLNHFIKIKLQLDNLLTEREQMILVSQKLSPVQQEILKADGIVLKDIRDLELARFTNYYARASQAKVTRDVGALLSLAGAGTGGFLGSLNSLLAVSNHQPRRGGTAGIGFIISGSIVALTPLLIRATSQIAENRAARQAQKTLGEQTQSLDKLETDQQHLLDLLAQADNSELAFLNGLSARTAAYQLHKEIFENQNIVAAKKADQSKRTFREQLAFSSIVGGTNLARGIQVAIAGFGYPNNAKTGFLLTATASTTYMVGAGAWIINTLQERTRAEILAQKIKAATSSTQAQLQDRLERLEEMEEIVSLY